MPDINPVSWMSLDGKPYLQYRNFISGGYFRGWVGLKIGEYPILSPYVNSIILKRSVSGAVINISGFRFWNETRYSFYNGIWNTDSSTVVFTGPFQESGFSVVFPDSAVIEPGDYTYEITKSDGKIITSDFYFPGRTDLPIPSSSLMIYQWMNDGSLKLQWTNPVGSTYNQLMITVSDQNGEPMLRVYFRSAAVETVTLPVDLIDKLEHTRTGQTILSANWSIQTRAYSFENMNYARGISDTKIIQWRKN